MAILKNEFLEGNSNTDSVKSLIIDLPEDSLKNALVYDISYHFYRQNDSLAFRHWNEKTMKLSKKLSDSLRMAEAHWDLASFFVDYEIIDSAYFHYNKASILYSKAGDDFYSARMLLNLAILQKNVKDYTGSETTTARAIRIIKPLQEHRQLYIGYNNLGILFNQLAEYDKALEYHRRAMESARELHDPVLEANTLNNIGVVYENDGEYNKAIVNYEKALLVDSLFQKQPSIYAMLQDNLAYSRMKANPKLNVESQLMRSLHIRDSIQHSGGVVINKLHLSEYHLGKGDTLKAVNFASEAKNLAEETMNYRDLLASMLLLSKIDLKNSNNYLNDYVTISDSLQREERAIRNKFARIRFETDEFIARNENLSREMNYIYMGSAAVLGVILLVFVNVYQRNRNKQLKLEQDQQHSNEEIYNLLLVQQNKLEEGRHREKNRISKELHDGILGKLFGVRFMLESLHDKTDKESLESRKKYIQDLRSIEEEVRNVSHDLQSDFFSHKESFLEILAEYLANQEKAGNFELHFQNDEFIEWEQLSSKLKINLFRIIQEAVNNISKYAGATKVTISFREVRDNLEMLIQDNGTGFDTSKTMKGIGLRNMKSRVKSIHGTWKLSSGDGGTKIVVKVPVK
ncbi:ATP-binding protein [Salinimicrobium marinum]|uniref:ATP-binding protein n=1 Tax=Salinimicrobium marinum TaxID=680283 RepID=UPI001679D74E|nr:sensor histidine kinase [Salinimicrobium marinum]